MDLTVSRNTRSTFSALLAAVLVTIEEFAFAESQKRQTIVIRSTVRNNNRVIYSSRNFVEHERQSAGVQALFKSVIRVTASASQLILITFN